MHTVRAEGRTTRTRSQTQLEPMDDISIQGDLENHNEVYVSEDWMSSTWYEVDWDQVDSLEDMITILKAMDFKVSENYSRFEEIEPYLKEVTE